MTDISTPTGGSGAPASVSTPSSRRHNGIGTAALVVGVVGLVLAVLVIFAPLGAVLGIVAAVLGLVAVMRANQGMADNRGQALAGLITGVLGLGLGIAITLSVGSLLASHVTDFTRFGNCVDSATSAQARETCAAQLADRLER
jgi:hypothetical protein